MLTKKISRTRIMRGERAFVSAIDLSAPQLGRDATHHDIDAMQTVRIKNNNYRPDKKIAEE